MNDVKVRRRVYAVPVGYKPARRKTIKETYTTVSGIPGTSESSQGLPDALRIHEEKISKKRPLGTSAI